jgi:hypothetical protein
MANPTLYKKISTTKANNRDLQDVSSDDNTAVTSTLTKFVELFKAAHS